MGCIFKGSIGGCGCTTPITATFTVHGCNSLAYQGVTVSVYTSSGGTLLASGTTDATGSVTLSWSGAAGNDWVTVTGQSARFAAYGATTSITNGGSTTITLTPAAGYYCFPGSGCLLPLAATIHATDTLLGNATLTYQTSGTYAGQWIADTSYTYPGLTNPNGIAQCFSGTVHIHWTLGNVGWSCDPTTGTCPAYDGTYNPSTAPCSTSSVNTTQTQVCSPFSINQTVTYNGASNTLDAILAIYQSNGTWQGTNPQYQFVWNIATGTTVATRTWTE